MVIKANSRHSRHRQPIGKSHQGTFYPEATKEKPISSGEESREELNLSFQSHSNIILGHHDSSVPPRDMRAAPPASTNADLHLNSQQGSYSNQPNYHNGRPGEASNQWDEYSAQSVGNHESRDANTKNIWSAEKKPSFPKDRDSSFYSASTNPSIGAFSLEARSQRNYTEQQHSYEGKIRGMSDSINRVHLSSAGMRDDNKTTTASVASTNTYSSNTIPGIVAASSESTGWTGGSSSTGQQYQSNYSYGHQHTQSTMNSGAQAYYPSQYPIQQQQQRVPPGFQPHLHNEMTTTNSATEIQKERNFIYPKDSMSTSDSISYRSGHYQKDNSRGNTRKQAGKRREGQNRDRQHVGEVEGSNREIGSSYRNNRSKQLGRQIESESEASIGYKERRAPNHHHLSQNHGEGYAAAQDTSKSSSAAIRMIMNPQEKDLASSGASLSSSNTSALVATRLPLDRLTDDSSQATAGTGTTSSKASGRPILPSINDIVVDPLHDEDDDEYFTDEDEEDSYFVGAESSIDGTTMTTQSKKKDWLLRMNRRLTEVPIGDLDPSTTPISAIMNAWAKTKSSNGASMVEKWLNRAQEEFDAGNTKIVPTNKMFTMAVDAWAKSGEGVSAAQRAETILQHMSKKYQATGLENLRPTTGIFNAVINAWARSKDKIAPSRAEQILQWMDNLHKTNPSIQPDKYTFNTGM